MWNRHANSSTDVVSGLRCNEIVEGWGEPRGGGGIPAVDVTRELGQRS